MSDARKRRGAIPPKAGRLWMAEEDEAVRTLPANEAAAKTGRTMTAIWSRRHRLGVPEGRKRVTKQIEQNTAAICRDHGTRDRVIQCVLSPRIIAKSRPNVLISVPTSDGWIPKTVLVAFTRLNLDTAGCDVTGMDTQYAGVENNRPIIRKQFLEGPWDYWLSKDDDKAPRDGVNPLELAHLGLDVVGCPTPIYRNPNPGGASPLYYNAYDVAEVGYKPHSPQSGLQEVDAIGTGCFLVSRKVMETIKAPFATIWDEDGIRHIGGDLAFCQRAKAAGFRIWAHYDYPCTHWKEVELTATAEAFLSFQRGTR